jgi:hypothetical protein
VFLASDVSPVSSEEGQAFLCFSCFSGSSVSLAILLFPSIPNFLHETSDIMRGSGPVENSYQQNSQADSVTPTKMFLFLAFHNKSAVSLKALR